MTEASPRHRLVSIRIAASGARAAAVRFPGALAAALVAAALLIIAIHKRETSELLLRVTSVAALGVAWLFALELMAERARVTRRTSLAIHAGAILAVVGYSWLTRDDTTVTYATRTAQVALALHLSCAFAAFVGRVEPNGFWQFNQRLFVRFFESALWGGVLFAGLAIALWSLTALFEVRIPRGVFLDLAVVSQFVVQTWRFLAVVPRPLDELEHDRTYPNGLRVFTQYLLVPLALLYGIILYAYVARILVFWSWPAGVVGWLISGASIFGMTTLLFLHPARDRPEARWVRTYARWFYPAMLPLLAVLFVALAFRVRQYGVTERRYFLGALGVWLLGVAVYYIVTRSRNLVMIPVSLCAVALVTTFGPWGAYRTSEHSQQRRLAGMLERNGLLVGGKTVPASRPVAWTDQREISRTLEYLIEHHGPSAVTRWFAPVAPPVTVTAQRDAGQIMPASLMSQLGLTYVWPWETAVTRHYVRDRDQEAFDVSGFDRLVEISLPGIVVFTIDDVAYSARLDTRTATLQIARGSETLVRVPFDALFAGLAAHSGRTAPSGLMTLHAEAHGVRVKVLVRNLTIHRSGDGRPETVYGSALLCLGMR